MITAAPEHTRTDARSEPRFDNSGIIDAVQRIRTPLAVVRHRGTRRLGLALESSQGYGLGEVEHLWSVPALPPEQLGDAGFTRAHGVRFPYVAGEMATGIATAEMVIAMARAGMLGFFGAGGLPISVVERTVDQIASALDAPGLPWGLNLIHNLHNAAAEDALVDLLLARGVRRVCASAYLQLTPAVVRYACSGLRLGPDGRVERTNQLLAKLSRPEIAVRFASPAPAAMLAALVAQGRLSAREAELAAHVPLAEDITVESDSGGHTDNRPLVALFPTIAQAVHEVQARQGYAAPIRIGAAGGLGTPASVAAAFGLGAAYVVTGSVNQAAVESGLSALGRGLLAQASIEDVAMAPAADMFELGVKVQVLKRGTMFSVRALRLYECYRKNSSLESIPPVERERLEREIFREPLEDVWRQTQAYFLERNPGEIDRAKHDPKHLMALVFRSYLGRAHRWATQGDPDRVLDYQIWCGPAMGAFNAWTRGSFLAEPANRSVVQIARNLLEGAAAVTRAQQLRSTGLPIPMAAFHFRPRSLPDVGAPCFQ